MANSNGWGDGSANNNIGWGQGANNAIGWGDIHAKSWAGLTDISGAPTTDPDAQAFITAAAITDPTQQSAINTLVVDLKGYSIWTKMRALYPFVTDKTVEADIKSQMKFNLKDPRDLDAAFRLTWHGGGTWTANGYQPNGINGYADTKLNPSSILTNGNNHISYYSRTNQAASNTVEMGVFSNNGFLGPALGARRTSDLFQYYNGNTTTVVVTTSSNTDSTGHFIGNILSRTNTNNVSNVVANTLFGTGIYLGAGNISDVFQGVFGYSNKQCAFASIGDGLTDTEAANFYTAVQAFQTTLGRSIGTQTVSDADAQAFVTAANIQDQVEATAINNLVIGLKDDSLWTKMKAVYPFVGGTASTHKWNLKDPRDLDAAFRLVFTGGWTHSSTGAQPNGTNGYANTYFAPNGILAYNNNHLSYYSRTNTTAVYDIGSGDGTGATNLDLFLRRSGDTAGYDSGNFATNRNTFSNSDSRGFFNGTTVSTNSKYFKNGVNQNTKALSVSSVSSFNMYLGGFNESNISTFYGNKQIAFASIGDGLTDTEAANFYTAVQAFQTALSRNV
jgi:hypothetical protein